MSKALQAKNAEEAQEIVERTAKENVVAKIRRIETMDIGKIVRQGDIYIHRVDDKHKRGEEAGSRQLAIGESMGSRHIAEAPSMIFQGAAAPEWYTNRFTPLLGPCIVSKERFVITHPEHAHVDLPAGTYQITHQMDARTQRRAID